MALVFSCELHNFTAHMFLLKHSVHDCQTMRHSSRMLDHQRAQKLLSLFIPSCLPSILPSAPNVSRRDCFFFFPSTQATAKGFVLIQTKEVSMRPEDVKRVFQNNAEDLVEWISKGH